MRKERTSIKSGNGVPTIPISADHQNGDWLATDIYDSEWYKDDDTGIFYSRSGNNIIAMNGSSNVAPEIGNSDITIDEETRRLRLATIAGSNFGVYPNVGADAWWKVEDNGTIVIKSTQQRNNFAGFHVTRFGGNGIGDGVAFNNLAGTSIATMTTVVGLRVIGTDYAIMSNGKRSADGLPTYANNADALAGGLVLNDEYKTATGEYRIVV